MPDQELKHFSFNEHIQHTAAFQYGMLLPGKRVLKIKYTRVNLYIFLAEGSRQMPN